MSKQPPLESEKAAVLPDGYDLLMLANGYTTFPEASGGSKHFIEVAKTWLAAQQELAVMTPGIGIENCREEGLDGPFLTLNAGWADRLPVALMYIIRSLAAIARLPWRRRGCLCLYGTSDMLPDVLPAFIFRVFNPTSAFWVNCVFHLVPPPRRRAGSGLSNYLSYAGQRAALLLLRSAADMLVVDNALLKQELVKSGFPEDRVFVTRMGVNAPAIIPPAPHAYDAFFLGRLHPSKGVFDLVSAWRTVCDARPGSRLGIAGVGPDALIGELTGRIRETGLTEEIDLLGYVSRDRAERLMAGSKAFVFPSFEEGFGISILEAMGFGLPVIAYELPHYREVFGDALKTVPIGDVDSLSRNVLMLLDDRALREEMAARARELASGYSWRSVSLAEAEAIRRGITSG